jgi:hypothetical protein
VVVVVVVVVIVVVVVVTALVLVYTGIRPKTTTTIAKPAKAAPAINRVFVDGMRTLC